MTVKPIPASVLAILQNRWKEADPSHSAFDAAFNDADARERRERRSDPSHYLIPPDRPFDAAVDALTRAEAVSLVRGGVFGPLAKVCDNGVVAINEHAQHALVDFCSEVYAAWDKYERRIAEVRAACPPPHDE